MDELAASPKRSHVRLLLTGVALVFGGVMIVAGSLACVPFDAAKQRLDSAAGDGSADAVTVEVYFRFQVAAAVLAVSAACVCVIALWHRRVSRLNVIRAQLAKLFRDARLDLLAIWCALRNSGLWIPAILVVAGGARLPYIDQPMRYDEAHTFVRYASRPLPLIFVEYEYDEANNHIFHSACVAMTTRLAGDSPAAIRSTALLAGMLIPVAVYLLTVTWYRRSVAGLAGLLTSVVPVLVFYSVNARGYTLTCVLMLVAAASAQRSVQRNSSFAWCGSIVSLSLAMWTIPTMVYGTAGVFGTLAMHSLLAESRFASLTKVAIAGLCVAMLTFAFYMPIVLAYGPQHLSQLGSEQKLGPYFAVSLPLTLWRQFSVWTSQGIPNWVGVGLCGASIVGGLTLGCVSRQRSLVVAPAVIIVVILLHGVLPPARTWSFAVPFLCVLAVVGIDAVIRATSLVQVRYGEAVLTCVILIAVITIGVQSHRNRYVLSSEETGFFPEGFSVTEYLDHHLVGREPVISVTPASAVLVYYARKHQLPESHFMMPGLGYTDDSAAFLVVDRRSEQMPLEVLNELGLGDLFPPENAVLATSIEKADIYRIRASGL